MSIEAEQVVANADAGEWLAFCVDAQEYGIDIQRVQEIRSFETPTRIVNAPACMLGVIDLRGQIVPLLDVHHMFGVARPADVASHVVIFTYVKEQLFGWVVSSVSDVVTLGKEHIRPAPTLNGDTSGHIAAIAKYEDRTLLLTHVDKLVAMSRGGVASAA